MGPMVTFISGIISSSGIIGVVIYEMSVSGNNYPILVDLKPKA